MAKFSVAVRSDMYSNLINSTLGNKEIARKFVADITTVVSQNPDLQDCEAGSIISAGLVAQSLNLPLSNSLGFAYIVPFNCKNKVTGMIDKKAQFQVGYKGWIQLVQRSGLIEKIGVRAVHEGEYLGQDEDGEDTFKFDHKYDNNKVIGYYAYFKTTNGFRKSIYWTINECEKHGKHYSKTFAKGYGLWVDQFDLMCQKTVLKALISKYAPTSVEIQNAIKFDQSVVNNDMSNEYVDSVDELPEETQTAKRKSTVKNVIEENVIEPSDNPQELIDDDAEFRELFKQQNQ